MARDFRAIMHWSKMITYKVTCVVGLSDDVNVVLSYNPDDPFSVTFSFEVDDSRGEVDWVFHRDLLMDSLDGGQAGEGDVQFFADDEEFIMEMTSPEGSAMAAFDIDEMRAFVDDIYELVEYGKEDVSVTDEAIENWLFGDTI
jgi:hypothetical protein